MEKRCKEYLKAIDEMLNDLASGSREFEPSMIERHLVQISFFQHERLIHLIVTALFAVMTVLSLMLLLIVGGFVPVALLVLLLVLLVPYVRHYYILENSVQRMYEQYDRMVEFEKK